MSPDVQRAARPKARVLFVCTGNSARSQMAEGLLRHMAGDRFEVFSAGSQPSRVREEAVAVMAELGIDISHHRSKSIEEFLGQPFDYVITVCDHARQVCPVFPGPAHRLHWGLEDPAAAPGDWERRLAVFRKVRDRLADLVRAFAAHAAEP